MKQNPFRGLAHVAIFTQSNERSVDFYTKAMGFEVVYHEIMGTRMEPRGVFPADFVLIRLGDLYMELIESFGPLNGTKDDKRHPNTIGTIDHIGISVSDIRAAVKQLQDYGYEEPIEIKFNDYSYENRPFSNANLKGPDGEQLTLYELDNNVFWKRQVFAENC